MPTVRVMSEAARRAGAGERERLADRWRCRGRRLCSTTAALFAAAGLAGLLGGCGEGSGDPSTLVSGPGSAAGGDGEGFGAFGFDGGLEPAVVAVAPIDAEPVVVVAAEFDESAFESAASPEDDLRALGASLSDGFSLADLRGLRGGVDLDGDGVVSRRERRQTFREVLRGYAEANLERFDADGDGVLSDEELRAARQELFGQVREQFQEIRNARADTDGDGVLSPEELAALEADQAERQAEREQRQQDFRSQADADGDGEVSNAEREQFRETRQAEREQERLERFDADGDGVLSDAEQAEAREAEADERQERQDRRELELFRGRYDSDGDGDVDSTDFNVFLERNADGHLQGDVNVDNLVDQSDVTLFIDMMNRLASADAADGG